jgi:hypothetical protein
MRDRRRSGGLAPTLEPARATPQGSRMREPGGRAHLRPGARPEARPPSSTDRCRELAIGTSSARSTASCARRRAGMRRRPKRVPSVHGRPGERHDPHFRRWSTLRHVQAGDRGRAWWARSDHPAAALRGLPARQRRVVGPVASRECCGPCSAARSPSPRVAPSHEPLRPDLSRTSCGKRARPDAATPDDPGPRSARRLTLVVELERA